MRTLTLALLLLVSPTEGYSKSVEPVRTPVAVSLVGDDGLTLRLSDAIQSELGKDDSLRPAKADDHDVVRIVSDSHVGWDTLGGLKVVIYTVYVFRGSERGEPKVGICPENDLSKCAIAILRLARFEAEDSR
jgi:hypothetical protein